MIRSELSLATNNKSNKEECVKDIWVVYVGAKWGELENLHDLGSPIEYPATKKGIDFPKSSR